MMDEERFQQVKEKEITRLTTPMSYPKLGGFTFRVLLEIVKEILCQSLRVLEIDMF